MQNNEKSHLIDAPHPSLFESAVVCAVLEHFGPIYQEVEAIRIGESNGDRLDLLLSEIALKAVTEIRDSPPERGQLIGNCFLNEMRSLTDQYDAMMQERFKANTLALLSYHSPKPGDGGTEQPSV